MTRKEPVCFLYKFFSEYFWSIVGTIWGCGARRYRGPTVYPVSISPMSSQESSLMLAVVNLNSKPWSQGISWFDFYHYRLVLLLLESYEWKIHYNMHFFILHLLFRMFLWLTHVVGYVSSHSLLLQIRFNKWLQHVSSSIHPLMNTVSRLGVTTEI